MNAYVAATGLAATYGEAADSARHRSPNDSIPHTSRAMSTSDALLRPPLRSTVRTTRTLAFQFHPSEPERQSSNIDAPPPPKGPLWNGDMDGAVSSGERAAGEVLAAL